MKKKKNRCPNKRRLLSKRKGPLAPDLSPDVRGSHALGAGKELKIRKKEEGKAAARPLLLSNSSGER
jgi:hypothetical protein